MSQNEAHEVQGHPRLAKIVPVGVLVWQSSPQACHTPVCATPHGGGERLEARLCRGVSRRGPFFHARRPLFRAVA